MNPAKSIFRVISRLLAARNVYFTKSLNYRREPLPLEPNFDYVRYAALALCSEEIRRKGLLGKLAEVGVYQGDFSMKLNRLFPDRELYLFDTFEGFSAADVLAEREDGFSDGSQDFSDTSVEKVLGRMPFPGRCVVRKGIFPKTAEGIEDMFCLVSIDADLYQPVYEALRFFYPRLEVGGYIFVHDVNNDHYPGARKALERFCAESGAAFTPIPDSGGTSIVAK